MPLDPGVARCHGVTRLPGLPVRHKTCDRRRHCLRWLELATETEQTPVARHLCNEVFEYYLPVN